MAVLFTGLIPLAGPTLLLSVTFVLLFVRTICRSLHLRHIPGPFLARFTDLHLLSKIWTNGNLIDLYLGLHNKYGPVVQYGPNRVVFSDPAAIPVIFSTKNILRKGESYEAAAQAVKGKVLHTFVSLRDEARVSAIKKHIVSAFTTTAILDYEAHIDLNLQRLIRHLHDADRDVDIAGWNCAFAYDTMCRIAFSEDQGSLDTKNYASEFLAAARDRFMHWSNWWPVPRLERLIFKNKIVTRKIGSSPLAQMAATKLENRNAAGGVGTHQDLLDRYLQASKKNSQLFDSSTILGLVLSTIHAGSETTAHSLTVALYHLLHHPRVMKTLRAELDEANLSSPPQWTEVSRLPYLDAVLKESSRVTPLALGPFEREVPASGIHIAGTFVPGGTIVAMNVHALNRDASIWGSYPEEFRPERWLEADATQLVHMERSNLYFSAGKRICIGQHIAWIEMKKCLPALLNQFDIELKYPERPLETGKPGMIYRVEEMLVHLTPRSP